MKIDRLNNQECNLLNLNIKEQSKIAIALEDYYYKLMDKKDLLNATLVKEMLNKLDVIV